MSTHVLQRWEPENPGFWQQTGARIANRNLWISIPALMLAFSIWMLWSVVVVNLDRAGFMLSKNQMFWLTALPALSGATLRIFYSFLVPVFGGRKWTAISTASLLIPALGMGFAARSVHLLSDAADPGAAVRPGRRQLQLQHGQHQLLLSQGKKGLATGLNAGIGNLGVSLVQFAVPVAISAGMFGALGGEPQQAMVRARRPISGCRTPASSGCCRSRWPRWRPGSA